MASILKVSQLQKPDGSTPTAADLGIDVASGDMPAGSVLQYQSSSIRDRVALTTTATVAWGLSVTITPKQVGSKLVIRLNGHYQPHTELYGTVFLYKNGAWDSETNSTISTGINHGSNGGITGVSMDSNNSNNEGKDLSVEVTAVTTSLDPVTYDIRSLCGHSSYYNFSVGMNTSGWGQAGVMTLSVTEIAQ